MVMKAGKTVRERCNVLTFGEVSVKYSSGLRPYRSSNSRFFSLDNPLPDSEQQHFTSITLNSKVSNADKPIIEKTVVNWNYSERRR